jgi:DNA repair protein RecO (recombination protein O)
MALVTTDAIVLRSYNLAESDRIVLCLTRSAGLVRAVAKGARKMKSRFGAALEPFTVIKLTFYERENRELVTMSSADILQSHFALNTQLETAEVLAYMGELVSEFAPPHEADERLYRMLTACVAALNGEPEIGRAITRYFEIWLLRLAGLFPDLASCAECGRDIAESDGVFVDAALMPHCRNCRPALRSTLSAEAVRMIRASQQLAPPRFAKGYEASEELDAELSDLTHRLIARAIDRRPRTLLASAR